MWVMPRRRGEVVVVLRGVVMTRMIYETALHGWEGPCLEGPLLHHHQPRQGDIGTDRVVSAASKEASNERALARSLCCLEVVAYKTGG